MKNFFNSFSLDVTKAVDKMSLVIELMYPEHSSWHWHEGTISILFSDGYKQIPMYEFITKNIANFALKTGKELSDFFWHNNLYFLKEVQENPFDYLFRFIRYNYKAEIEAKKGALGFSAERIDYIMDDSIPKR